MRFFLLIIFLLIPTFSLARQQTYNPTPNVFGFIGVIFGIGVVVLIFIAVFFEDDKEMRKFKKKQREEDNKRKYVGKGLFKKRRVWAKDVVDPKTGKVIGVKHPETGELLDVRFRYGMGEDYKWTWRDIG